MEITQSVSSQSNGTSRSPGRSLVLARAHISRNLSRALPYYITRDEYHALKGATEDDRDRLLLTVLCETGTRLSEAIAIRLRDVGRVERVVFVRDSLVSSILFYAHEQGMGRDDFLFPSRKEDM